MLQTIVKDLFKIFQSGVSAVVPTSLLKDTLKYNAATQQLMICKDIYNLNNKNVYLVGFGKAVQDMANETEAILGSKLITGIVSIPIGSSKHIKSEKLKYYEGAKNNLPDASAQTTSIKIVNLLKNLDSNDLLLVLISGGGSALLALPKDKITLEDKHKVVKSLANSGADIKELNIVRKKLSQVKGGQLAIHAQPAKVISLILSDIVGDPIDLIASGPTTQDNDSIEEAINILQKYQLLDQLPESIKSILYDNNITDKFPTDNVVNYIIGSNKLSLLECVKQSPELNYDTITLSNCITGDLNIVAKKYARLLKTTCDLMSKKTNVSKARDLFTKIDIPHMKVDSLLDFLPKCTRKKGICFLLGGELTLEVTGHGKGGRNQHFALELSRVISENSNDYGNLEIYFLSAGTDGIDGPTDAAGAIGYSGLVADAKHENLDIDEYLRNNNSYEFYKNFKNGQLHIFTGHTFTNVMDLHVILIKEKDIQ